MTENRMELFIETLTGTAFELSCSPLETIVSIKAKIQYSEGIPVSQQHLIWKSQELNDDLCLQDYHINDGATLKLVLGLRGGPINTRQITDSKKLKDLADYVERNSETAGSGGRPFTVLVFQDGDKVHMYTLMERGECTVSPLSGTISETSSITSIKNVEELDHEIAKENEATREKILHLQEQLRRLQVTKPKKYPADGDHSGNLAMQTKPAVGSCQGDFYLPPIHQTNSFDSESRYKTSNKLKMLKTHFPRPLPNLERNSNLPLVLDGNRTHNKLQYKRETAHTKNLPTTSEDASTAFDCIPNNISSHVNTPTDKTSSERKSSLCSNFLPYIASQKPYRTCESPPASANGKSTPCRSSVIKHDPSRLKQTHKQLPVTSSLALSSKMFIDLDDWLQNRPKTSPEKPTNKNCTGGQISQNSLGQSELHKYKFKCIKTPRSVDYSSDGKSSILVKMLNSKPNVMFNLTPDPASRSKRNGDNSSYSKPALGSKVESTSKALNLSSSNDLEAHEGTQKFSSDNPTQRSPQQNEPPGRPLSVKKLPLIKPKKKSYKRCSLCSKKTGLATSYVCRCGKNFCASHRYAELHHCSYDYKTEGRRLLQLNNPVVAASKLPKI